MDRIINRLSNRWAKVSSRRGFLATLGKVALVASGTVAAVQGAGLALASNCCNAGGTYFCSSCPSGTSNTYEWTCCGGGTVTYCDDCTDSQGHLVCVIARQTNIVCGARPSGG
jgi:hypothetical protein